MLEEMKSSRGNESAEIEKVPKIVKRRTRRQ
jgi:hypothetical protein